MNWIVANIRPIMLLSGILTCTMLYAAVAPQTALRSMFGNSLEGPLAEIVVRNWGVLITLIGAMLIYAAGRPVLRPLVLVVAGIGKLAFVGLVLVYGRSALGEQVGVAVVSDLLMVSLFLLYLLGARR